MFRLRRLTTAILEDFGLRRQSRARSVTVVRAPATTVAVPAAALPPGVVWHGSAARSPALQRFVEHLESTRQAVLTG